MKNFSQKYVYVFLIASSFSTAAERVQPLVFSKVQDVKGAVSSIVRSPNGIISLILNKKNGNAMDSPIYAAVNVVAGLVSEIENDRNSEETILNNALNSDYSHLDVVFKGVSDFEVLSHWFNAINKEGNREKTIINFSNDSRSSACSQLAKKTVFLNFNKYKGIFDSEAISDGSIITSLCAHFDYESLFNHMNRLLAEKGKYCFSVVVSEDGLYGSVTFNKNSAGKIECIDVGVSSRVQALACVMAGSKNNEYLKRTLIQFLGERYKVPTFTKKIEELDIEKTHTLYLKYVDEDKGSEKYTKLMEDFTEKAENELKEAENKLKAANEAYNNLFNEMTVLKAAASKSSITAHFKDIIKMFLSKEACELIFVIGFTYYLFIKK